MVATSKSFGRGHGPFDRINQARSNDWSVGSNNGSSILRAAHAKRSPSPSRTAVAVNKYTPQRNPNTGNNIAAVRSSILSRGSTPQERFQNMQKTNGSRIAGGGYSNKGTEDFARVDSLDSFDAETMNTDLFRKFEDAFNNTLKNNPGILPGAPTVVKSIKTALFKKQKSNASKEAGLRKQLDQVNEEISSLEQRLSQQKEKFATKKGEWSKELDGIEIAKKDIRQKIDEANAEKDEMAKHLDFLSKARSDIEKALQTEVKAVEKDRDALEKINKDRKKIQQIKEENERLKDEVVQETEMAKEETQALKDKKEELRELAEKNKALKKENEAIKKDIETEQRGLLEINTTLLAKKAALLEKKKASQDQIDELDSELAKTNLSNVQKLTSYITSCGDGQNEIVDRHLHPGWRTDDEFHTAIRTPGAAREVAFEHDVGITSPTNARIASELTETKRRSRSRSRSKSRRRKNGKHDDEEDMKNEIDNLRIELEAVRARNNMAMQDQEARDAENAIRADIRVDRRNSLLSPREYSSPGLRHRERDREERYYSFLHKEREPISPHYSRASPASRHYHHGRSSFPYSDRVTRTTPEWRR